MEHASHVPSVSSCEPVKCSHMPLLGKNARIIVIKQNVTMILIKSKGKQEIKCLLSDVFGFFKFPNIHIHFFSSAVCFSFFRNLQLDADTIPANMSADLA